MYSEEGMGLDMCEPDALSVDVAVVIFVLFEVGVEVDLGLEVETDERSHLRGHVTVFDRKVTVLGGA